MLLPWLNRQNFAFKIQGGHHPLLLAREVVAWNVISALVNNMDERNIPFFHK
jgi:hypothetical protein